LYNYNLITMKKFKLIQTYPGSPELGFVITPTNGWGNTYNNAHKYPEFWEEIIEYPVGTEAFNSQTHSTYIKKEDGWYKKSEKIGYTDEIIAKANHINVVENKTIAKDYEILSYISKLKNCIIDSKNPLFNNGVWDIHSVKRLSDGEVFTLGDIVGTLGFNFPVVEFNLHDEENTVVADSYDKKNSSGRYNCRLKDLKKVRKPLFKTEDGVDIFKGDFSYFLTRDFKLTDKKSYHGGGEHSGWYFASKEKAEEFVLMNKPLLSISDAISVLEFYSFYKPHYRKEVLQKLEALAKSRI